MKQIKSVFFFCLTIIVLFGNYSCKQKCQEPTNPDCENYDPCYGKNVTSAAFKMFETIQVDPSNYGGFFQDYETDTIFGGRVKFVAEDSSASTEYEWQIGAGVYTKRSFNLSFTSLKAGQSVPITLIIKKANVDKMCFPNDDGIDTVTRVLNKATKSRVIGFDRDNYTFQGYNTDEPSKNFKIQIYYTDIWIYTIIKGLLPTIDSVKIDGSEDLYRALPFSSTSGISIIGNVFITPNDSIRLDYRYSIDLSPMKTKTYVGRRVKP